LVYFVRDKELSIDFVLFEVTGSRHE
jgi:hypothetical protein